MYIKNLRLYCVFLFCFQSYSLTLGHYDSFNKIFKNKLLKKKLNEPHIHAILFNKNIILIGAISDCRNLNSVLYTAQVLSLEFNKQINVCNFLVYKYSSENHTLKNKVIQEFRIKGYILPANYSIFVMGQNVWVIGYARTCFEKDSIKEVMNKLKRLRIVHDYYLFIKYKSTTQKGFVYRHNV